MELIRYIHLNPIRAKIIKTIDELEKYKWSGHGAILGKNKKIAKKLCVAEKDILIKSKKRKITEVKALIYSSEAGLRNLERTDVRQIATLFVCKTADVAVLRRGFCK